MTLAVVGVPVGPPPNPVDMSLGAGPDIGFSVSGSNFINFHAPASRPFNQDELARIRSGAAAVGSLVHLTYEDVFGNTHDEETGFYVQADAATLEKLTNNYQGKDLEVQFRGIEGYGRST